MTVNSPLKFRVRVSPDWQALHPVIKERAGKLGFNWPSTSHPARFPRVYTVTLAGQVEDTKLLNLDASALEPPKETVVSSGLKDWEALVVSFKVAGKRAFTEASPQAKAAPDVLAVHLDRQGLYLPKVSEAGLTDQRLVDIPLPKLVQGFADLLLGKASIKRTGVDHIVERYSSLPDLDAFQVSKWRGDGFYRLAAPWVRIEISVDPATRA